MKKQKVWFDHDLNFILWREGSRKGNEEGFRYKYHQSASRHHLPTPELQLLVSNKRLISLLSLVKQASAFPNIKIIEVSWLLDSFDASKQADEDDYILSPSVSKAKDKNGKKRARSETPPEDEASPSAEENEKLPAKKQKDEEIPTSKPLHIPVDDECPLAGWLSDNVALCLWPTDWCQTLTLCSLTMTAPFSMRL